MSRRRDADPESDPPMTNRFVLCVRDDQHPASLERGKVYGLVKPQKNDPRECVRVIDESGEDYLYARSWFVPIHLTARAQQALAHG